MGSVVTVVTGGHKATVNGCNDEADSLNRASMITISWGGAVGAAGTVTTKS